ncbi:MAG: substrate-binding domain-containing protein [Anaerolineaceae bacterium]|nr:substrate-binding domain-containing protein [Anaerolineaceae bacterium]
MKKVVEILVIVGVMLSLAACGNTAPVVDDAGEQGDVQGSVLEADDGEVYYMLAFFSGIEYWQGCYEGFQKAAEMYGATTEFGGPTDMDTAAYVDYIESVIAKKPAGIALTCSDPDGLADVINKAIDAGIPVVTYDSDSAVSNRLAYLGTGNYNAGVEAAKFIAEQVGHIGQVAVVGAPTSNTTQIERIDGFVEYIEQNEPDMEIVAVEDGGADSVESSKAAASLMQAYPELVGIYTTSAQMGAGVATAVEEADKVGEIAICAFDTDEATLDFIDAGVITGSVVQGVELMGFWAFQFLFQVEHDLVVDNWQENGLTPIPTTIDTGVSICTKDNIDIFR